MRTLMEEWSEFNKLGVALRVSSLGEVIRLPFEVRTPTGGVGMKRALRLKKAIRGRLIPAHYEWLMGWPIGFTDSRQSATVKSQSKPRSRGES